MECYNDELWARWGREGAFDEHKMEVEDGAEEDDGQRRADEWEAKLLGDIEAAVVNTEMARLRRLDVEASAHKGLFREMEEVKAEYLGALRRQEREPSADNRESFTCARKRWKAAWRTATRELEKDRTSWWRGVMRADEKELWKEMEWLEGGKRAGDGKWLVKRKDGSVTETEEEALLVCEEWCKRVSYTDWAGEVGAEFDERWMATMKWWQEWQDWRREDSEEESPADEAGGVLREMCNADLTMGEKERGMQKGKKGKARGGDGVANEAVLVMDAKCREKLGEMWGEIWKSGACPARWKEREVQYLDKKEPSKDLDKKRGISLLSCMGKKYTQAVTSRLRTILEATGSRTQGAVAGRGVGRQVAGLVQLVGSRLRRGKKTIGVLLDLKKAFDTVDHQMLRAALLKRGVSGKLLEAVMAKYQDRRARVKVRGEGGVLRGGWWNDRGKGVTQGGVDSMDLFGVMVDALEEALIESGVRGVDCEEGGRRWRLMMYADDVVLVAESQDDARMAVKAAEEFYLRWGLAPNPKKCEVIVWEEEGKMRPRIEMMGKELDVRTDVIYLGVVMNNRGTWKSHMKRRAKKAARWRWKVRNVTRRKGAAPIEVGLKMNMGGERAAWLYGAELWAQCRGGRYEEVRKAQLGFERNLLGAPGWVTDVGVRKEMGEEDWMMSVMVRKFEVLKELLTSDRGMSTDILRERVAGWKMEAKEVKGGGYDWAGEALWWLWNASHADGDLDARRMMEALTDEATPWKKVAKWVEEWVARVIQNGWEEKDRAVMSRGKGEEYDGKVAWPKRWREARNGLTTEEVKWVERARMDGLEVEDELGRRGHVRKQERTCQGCGAARGTAEHWLQRCRVTGGVRQKLDEKWGKCGMRGVPLWGWLMNPNVGRVADEKSRIEAVRCANWAIRTMMRMKVAKEEVHPGGDDGRVEGSCGETGGKLDELPDPGNERGTRGGRRAKKSPEGGEVCFLAQKVDEMDMRKEAASTKDGRVKLELERLLQKQSGGVLWVEYGRARGGEGRWYARGNAQLQSCKRETRHAALRGVGWEVDLRAAYPTMLLAKAERIGERRRQWPELKKYVENVDEMRRKVAEELGIGVKNAKRGFNAVIFGMTVRNWVRKEGVRDGRTSETMVRFDREIRRARTLLAEEEIRRNPEMAGKKETTTLSRVVEREEEKVMRTMRTELENDGWTIGTLLHDALVVHKRGSGDLERERRDLEGAVSRTLDEWNEAHGWSRSPEGVQLRAAVEAL